MEFEQILKLIDHVSASRLESFCYENDGLKITLNCEKKSPSVVLSSNTNSSQKVVQILPEIGNDLVSADAENGCRSICEGGRQGEKRAGSCHCRGNETDE